MAQDTAKRRASGRTRSETAAVPVRVDSKGRLLIPREARTELGIRPGDTFFFQRSGRVLHYAKIDNPFDALAEEAEREYREGTTRELRAFAREQNIDLDAE